MYALFCTIAEFSKFSTMCCTQKLYFTHTVFISTPLILITRTLFYYPPEKHVVITNLLVSIIPLINTLELLPKH